MTIVLVGPMGAGKSRVGHRLATSVDAPFIDTDVRIAERYGPIDEVFDLRPAAIIRDLDLLRPIYGKTAAYGHFGRELPDFTWERTDRVEALRKAAGL